jgi:hypothetical protein
VEGVHDCDGVGNLLGCGGLGPGEPVHRDHVDAVAPDLVAVSEPGLERLFGAALDHVEQPSGSGAVADRGEIDDHGDVLVTAPGVAPHVLIDLDENPLAFGQDRVVGGVPRDPEAFGDPGDGEVLDHDPFQCPPQPAARQLRPRLGRSGEVFTSSVGVHDDRGGCGS